MCFMISGIFTGLGNTKNIGNAYIFIMTRYWILSGRKTILKVEMWIGPLWRYKNDMEELILDNCVAYESDIMGKTGDGFKVAMSGLDGGRIGIASQAVGLAQGALEKGVRYANTRVQFGKPVSANQGLQWYIADMATRVEAARLLTLQAASK